MFKICNRPRAVDFESRLAAIADQIEAAHRAVPASPAIDAAERRVNAASATVADLAQLFNAAEHRRISTHSEGERKEIAEIESRLGEARAELGNATRQLQEARQDAADGVSLAEPLQGIRSLLTDGMRNIDRVIEQLELAHPVALRSRDTSAQRFCAAHRELSGGLRLLRQVFNRVAA